MLPARVDIGIASELKADLMALLSIPGPIVVDASAVQRVDGAGVQLLTAFQQRARATWLNPTPPLREAIILLGLGELWGDSWK